MASFRNYTLPGPGGPSPIVAVFWDDLLTTGGGDVFTYYNPINDTFIVEWSDVRTYYNNTVESFQVILYNSGWQTHTGDDEIKLQYKEFNNNSTGDYPVGNYDGPVIHGQYCTVGIENHLGNDGLQYTYNNVYPQAASNLSNYSALFISTRNPSLSSVPTVDYNENSFTFSLDNNEIVEEQLILTNSGEEGSVLYYDVEVSPFSTAINQIDNYGYAWASSIPDDDVNYNWIDLKNPDQRKSSFSQTIKIPFSNRNNKNRIITEIPIYSRESTGILLILNFS